MLIEPLQQKALTLEEIQVGSSAEFDLCVEEKDLEAFACLSGDNSDLHMNREAARRSRFRERVAHGMLPMTAISALVGMRLPGRHAVLLAVEASFRSPVRIGERLRIVGRVASKSASTRIIKLQILITNLITSQLVTEGTAEVYVAAPPKKGVTMSELQELELSLDFTGKTVLITGASRGIGEATAKLFAHRRANVVVNYRIGKSDAEGIVAEIARHGGRAIAVQGDVSVPAEVEAMVQSALAAFQRVDILVNNAVRSAEPARFEELDWEQMQRDIDVTVKGAFLCSKAVLGPMLAQGGGCIINVSTVFTEAPVPNFVGYITSKSGLVGLSRALAVELADRGIRVNLVTPGVTPTDLTNTLSDQVFKRLAQENPMKRTCQPLDIAKAILMLASPYTQYMTGQQVMVTGGSPPLL